MLNSNHENTTQKQPKIPPPLPPGFEPPSPGTNSQCAVIELLSKKLSQADMVDLLCPGVDCSIEALLFTHY